MSADQTIREILEKYDERPGDGVTWKVQSATVITHKALERIAAKAKISFDPPQVLRAERDEAVILVSGSIALPPNLGAAVPKEWSIGEALVNVNYRVSGKQAAYVYAMAEKRAKDRVILKLIGLHGLLYSEDEADDFRQPAEPIDPSAAQWVKEVERCVSRADLTALFRTDEWKEAKARMTPAGQRMVQDAVARHPEYQTREVAA